MNEKTRLPRLHGRSEVADQFGISERTLDRAVADGELKNFKIGTRVLYAEEDLLAWLESKSSHTETEATA